MAAESKFVKKTKTIIADVLPKNLHVERGAPLLYTITVDNNLQAMGDDQIKNPRRGASAFQTDLCIFEDKKIGGKTVSIPRVVIEFKTRITTHDILTYSTKALKHKQIYPYLRYGILASDETTVPGRFFTHNEGLDFFMAVGKLSKDEVEQFLKVQVKEEIASSRLLEEIVFSPKAMRLFRTEIQTDIPGKATTPCLKPAKLIRSVSKA
jgi:hypothetical protein